MYSDIGSDVLQPLLSSFPQGLVYPISARLVWGDGWLQQMGFVDFAGAMLTANMVDMSDSVGKHGQFLI